MSDRTPEQGELRGTIAVTADEDGYGFIEPLDGGGQLLVRLGSINSGLRLRVGENVRYTLAPGSFALEAVAVSRLSHDAEGTA
jgi:cold shock CspA family protein